MNDFDGWSIPPSEDIPHVWNGDEIAHLHLDDWRVSAYVDRTNDTFIVLQFEDWHGEKYVPFVIDRPDDARRLGEALIDAAKPPERGEAPLRINNCPGCGRKLFGHVRLRGGCLDCFPEVTEDQIESIINEENQEP